MPGPKISQKSATYITMARAGARAYKGVWGCAPQWDAETKALGSQWVKPPEAEDILAFQMPVSHQIILKCIASCYAFYY